MTTPTELDEAELDRLDREYGQALFLAGDAGCVFVPGPTMKALLAASRSLPSERRAREEAERERDARWKSAVEVTREMAEQVRTAAARATAAEMEAASLRERVKALEDQMRAICSEFTQGHPLIAAGRRLLGMDRLVRAEFKTFDEWAAEARATLEEKPHD